MDKTQHPEAHTGGHGDKPQPIGDEVQGHVHPREAVEGGVEGGEAYAGSVRADGTDVRAGQKDGPQGEGGEKAYGQNREQAAVLLGRLFHRKTSLWF